MPGTAEAVAVLAVFVAPGFIAFYISREVSRHPAAKASDWELLLLAGSFASAMLALEVLAYAVVLGVTDAPLVAGVRVSELQVLTYGELLSNHPARVLSIVSAQYLGHIAFVAVLGWTDPVGKWLEAVRSRRGFTAQDPWIAGLETLRIVQQQPATFIRAILDSGDAYYGYLFAMSNGPRDDGSHDLVLQIASYGTDRDATPRLINSERPADTVVVLNTRNVRAVEALFDDPHREPSKT